jgi:hypothetical protein
MHNRARISESGLACYEETMLGWYRTFAVIRRENAAGTYIREHGPQIVYVGDVCQIG